MIWAISVLFGFTMGYLSAWLMCRALGKRLGMDK